MFDIKRVTAPLQVTNGEGEEMPPVMNKSFLTFKFRFPLKAPCCAGHARPADPSALLKCQRPRIPASRAHLKPWPRCRGDEDAFSSPWGGGNFKASSLPSLLHLSLPSGAFRSRNPERKNQLHNLPSAIADPKGQRGML